MKKIAFVLPRPTEKIVGGFKVVYDYARYLSHHGVEVSIIYDCHEIGTRFSVKNEFVKKTWGKYLYKKAIWAHMPSNIHIQFIGNRINECDADLLIATALNTVSTVNSTTMHKYAKKAYFIQDFENWGVGDTVVYDSYSLPMKKIVVSQWIYEIVKNYDSKENIFYCPNGINTNIFYPKVNIRLRNQKSVLFMYHEDVRKGMNTLKPVLNRLRYEFPDLIISAFGAFEQPDDIMLDKYVPFANEQQLHDLYNESSIFVCPSYTEGFGLTGAEAMACGCALVTTDTSGSREYANDSNAMICKTHDENDLYEKIKSLLTNRDKMYQISEKGVDDIKRMSLSEAENTFLKITEKIIGSDTVVRTK